MLALDTTLIYLLFAVVGVVGCRLLHLPAMLGYLVAGIFLAQGGALVEANEAAVASVAELGVVLLMFVIGLEFNLPKLMGMRRMVFGFGMAQVLVMVLGTLLGHLLLFKLLTFWQLPWDLTW
ncbi:MAG: cation:proton antiporter, partial [Burkholderiales bacterium]